MHLLYAVVVLMCLGAPVLGQPPVLPFDCKAPGLICANGGTCDPATGICTCAAGFELPDCNKPSTLAACADAAFCTNGDCSDVSGTDTCFCGGDYTGTKCETPRVDAACNIDDLTITITPYATFSGTISVLHPDPLITGCAAVTAGTAQTYTYADTGCPYASVDDGGTFYYTVKFLLQYKTTEITSTDEIIEVKCKVSSTVTLPAYSVVYPVDPATIYTNQKTYTGTFDPPDGITFAVESSTGTAIANGDTVKVGDEIVCIITQTVGGYDEFVVDSFTVDDGAGGTSVNILGPATDRGCVHLDAQPIFVSYAVDTLTAPGVTQVIKITTTVPKFLTTTNIKYTIVVTVCNAGDTACTQDTCIAPDIYLKTVATEVGTKDATTRRRRRAAGDESDKSSKTGSASFNLNVKSLSDDLNAIKNKLDRDSTATSCMRSIVFLIPMILLALMLLISMAMTLYFCLKVTRRRDKDDREFGPAVNLGYKA